MDQDLLVRKMMIENVEILLRVAGAGLIVLVGAHFPISQKLKWKMDAQRMSPVNEQIFHVHTFFLCITLFMMGLPCLLMPEIFLIRTSAGLWLSSSFAVFWAMRLYFQFFVYSSKLWRGKRLETRMHLLFSVTWLALTAVFSLCVMIQLEWL